MQHDEETQSQPNPSKGQIAMLILLPSQSPFNPRHESAEPPDFAVGTVLYDQGDVLT